MQIIIKTLTHKIIDLDVESSDRIGDIKLKIQNQQGIPTWQQILMFEEDKLIDDRTIYHYNILDQSVLCLVLKLRG
jgi:ubiquitin-large subunit ribosomal protein L40e